MGIAKRILKNTGYLTLGQSITLSLGMIWVAIFSRYVGPEGIGLYTFAQSILAIVVLFVDVGLQTLVIRTVSRQKKLAGTYFTAVFITKFALSILVYGLFFIFIIIVGWSTTLYKIMLAVCLTTFIFSMNTAIIAIFYACEKMVYDTIGQILNSILVLGGGFLGVYFQLTLVQILLIIALASLLRLLINLWHLFKMEEVSFPPRSEMLDWKFNLEMLKDSVPFAILTMVGVIYGNIFVIILRHFLEDVEVGYFSIAYRLYGFLFIVPQMFMNAVFPTLASSYIESKIKMARIYEQGYRYVMIISILMGVLAFTLAHPVIEIVFGEKFKSSILPFQILSLTLINGVGYINGPTLNAIGKERFFSLIFGITTVLAAVSCYLITPIFGIIGACWILLSGHICGFIIYSYVLFKWLDLSYPYRDISYLIIIGIVVGGITEMLLSYIHFILIGILITPMLYFILMFFFRILSNEDLNRIEIIIPQKYRKFFKA